MCFEQNDLNKTLFYGAIISLIWMIGCMRVNIAEFKVSNPILLSGG